MCEFEAIPAFAAFTDKRRIHRFRGELHLSLLDSRAATFARKPSRIAAHATLRALKERGCRTNSTTP